MNRTIGSLLAAIVVCCLLVPGVASATPPASDTAPDAVGGHSIAAPAVTGHDIAPDDIVNDTANATNTSEISSGTAVTPTTTADSGAVVSPTAAATTHSVAGTLNRTTDTFQVGGTTSETAAETTATVDGTADATTTATATTVTNTTATTTTVTNTTATVTGVASATVPADIDRDLSSLTAGVRTGVAVTATDTVAVTAGTSDLIASDPTAADEKTAREAVVTPADEKRSGAGGTPAPDPAGDGARTPAAAASQVALADATVPLPTPVPDHPGATAVGGVLILGLGYVGRRVITGGLGAGVLSTTTVTRLRVTASLLADAVRAREVRELGRWLPIIGGYSRYDDTDPLAHETRATIVDHLEATPGTYLSAIAEATDIPLPTVRYHMKILTHENLVEQKLIRGKRRYFVVGTDAEALAAALADDATREVLRALQAAEPATVTELATALDCDPSTVTYHCQRLADEGLIDRERDGPAKVARLTPEVRDALQAAPETASADTPAVADD